MDTRTLIRAMALAMALTPGLVVALTARVEFGAPIPLALGLGLLGAHLAKRMLLAPVF